MKHKHPGWKKDGLDLVDSLNLTKAEKKKLEKLDKISIHLQALFAAVEHSQVEKARTILATTDVDVNSSNSDGFLALDIAVLTNNLPLVKMLQGAGATENPSFCGVGERCAEALEKLLKEAGDRVENLTTAVLSAGSQSAPSSPVHRQLVLWRRRHRLLNAMKVGLQRLRPPDPPPGLAMEIVASDSVCLRFSEPEDQNLAVCTKVKAQWSCVEDFSLILGEMELLDIRAHQLTVNGLTPGSRYYFRLACGNIKGYGAFVNSQPASGVPSIWRDVDGRKSRFMGRPAVLDDLFDKLLTCRPEDASEIRDMEHTTDEEQKRVQKKSTFKQLFAAAPKFEKEKFLKRGLHLACIFYNEDKILVTNEEHLPIIEVDENSPAGPIHADFNWLTKVACTWKDVKTLRLDMEKLSTSPQIELRSKILAAISLLQSALGVQELGQFYYKHLRDGCGTVLLSCVNKIKNPKSIQSLSVKWMPMNKLQRKSTNLTSRSGDESSEGEPSVGDLLLASVHDQILYDQRNRVPLPHGLYLGYIKLQSSMDLLSILVPERTPNIFPHTKIRDNAHVSSEEWEWLQTLSSLSSEDGKGSGSSVGSAEQSNIAVHAIFERQLAVALKKLFAYLGVSDSSDTACSHRIYTKEVVEVSPHVAFIMVLPSPENVCSVPGQTHELLTDRRDFISVPVPIFEMAHLRTYQRDFVSRYCRLFSILELDQISAQQANREAFSNQEIDAAKRRLNRLQEVQTLVDNTWKGARWIMDLLSYARDKSSPAGSLSTAVVLTRNKSTAITADTSALMPTASQQMAAPYHSPEAAARQLAAGLMMRSKHPPAPLPPKSDGHTGIGFAGASNGKEKNLYKSNTSSNIDIRAHKKPSDLTQRSSTSQCLLVVPQSKVMPSSSSDSLHSSNESLFVAPTGGGVKPRVPIPPRPISSGSQLTVQDNWRKKAERDADQNSATLTLNQSRSENSLSVPCDSDDLKMLANRKISAPDCTEEVSMVSGKYRADSGFLSVEENFAKKKKYSLETPAAAASAAAAAVAGGMNWNPIASSSASAIYPNSDRSNGSSRTASLRSLSSNEELETGGEQPQVPTPAASVLQVYAAYKTGLAAGTSVKLHVTSRTSAREVVDLVVQQLNMAVVLKGKGGPVYSVDQLKDFCLVAVIGARERCLRDDFQPLQLQNPWRKGRLFVRRKGDVLAALQHGHVSSQTSYL